MKTVIYKLILDKIFEFNNIINKVLRKIAKWLSSQMHFLV